MEAKKSSSKKIDWTRAARTIGARLWFVTKTASHFVASSCAKAVPWGRDHILSLAVLLMFPLAIAAYFLGTPESDSPGTPRHLQSDPEAESLSDYEDDPYSDPTPLSSVIPDGPLTPEEPGGDQFPPGRERDNVEVPQPLPISVQDPEALISQKSRSALPTWNPHRPADYQIDESKGECVWLTGTIETFDPPRRIQNASRVHELTRPHPE